MPTLRGCLVFLWAWLLCCRVLSCSPLRTDIHETAQTVHVGDSFISLRLWWGTDMGVHYSSFIGIVASFKPIFPSIKQVWKQPSLFHESHWKSLSFISCLSRIKIHKECPSRPTHRGHMWIGKPGSWSPHNTAALHTIFLCDVISEPDDPRKFPIWVIPLAKVSLRPSVTWTWTADLYQKLTGTEDRWISGSVFVARNVLHVL